MPYRVLIASAGLGRRLKGMSKNVNKALVSVAHKPVISHIIEKFDPSIELVIPVGYKAQTVKDYVTLAYPNRKVIFVDVDVYEGEGSGLGYTILQCEQQLQCPFIFTSNDTIVLESIPSPDHNWMGYSSTENPSLYRSIRVEGQQVAEIYPKGTSGEAHPYIGLAGIVDYALFWEAMRAGVHQGSIEIGESYGLRFLLAQGITPVKFTWFDTGNIQLLEKTRSFFAKKEEAHILEKEEEAIWFVDDTVIKFSIDPAFIQNRVKRAASLKGFVPEIIASTESMYAYKKVEGEVFSKSPSLANFSYFLDWATHFWQKKDLNAQEKKTFEQACQNFYKEKTYKRVKQYFTTFERMDSEEWINGEKMPSIFTVMDALDWDHLIQGIPARIHGDLHFENMLVNANGQKAFTLLDWRQDFGGLLDYGDLYYDLAKLNHGLIVSHELIAKNLFSVIQKLNHIDFDFLRKQQLVACEQYFKQWALQNGYDYPKIQIMTALIFLNIATLHHAPYSFLLFYLGKSMLYEAIHKKKVTS